MSMHTYTIYNVTPHKTCSPTANMEYLCYDKWIIAGNAVIAVINLLT